MKRFVSRLALLFVSCSFYPRNEPYSKTIEQLENGISQVIVTYGTSLTEYGAWVSQIRSILSERYPGCVTLINSGAAGKDSRWGVENIRNKVLNFHPDCIFIEFGINDVLPSNAISISQSQINLETMVDSIIKDNPRTEIVLMTMNPRLGDSLIERSLFSYYDLYHKIAKERKCILVDNYSKWMFMLDTDPVRVRCYIPDEVHPTDEGCKAIVIPQIARTLGIEDVEKE
jgi:lysophospholipase L1-like esterase